MEDVSPRGDSEGAAGSDEDEAGIELGEELRPL